MEDVVVEYSQLIQQRFSVRAYSSQPVEPEKLQRVLEAARIAPTAGNRQPFGLIVADMRARQEEFARLYHRDWFLEAPLLILACGVPEQAWVHPTGKCYVDVDVAIVMDHLILAAANEGLGTCWIAHFNFDAARDIFQLPSGVVPLVCTPVGYPAQPLRVKERKPVADLVHYERW
jgi:nitroreductase